MKTYKQTISNDELNALPLNVFEKEIDVIDTIEKVDGAVEYLQQHSMIGFDTETRPSFKKGKTNQLALLQLSTEQKAFLFRICKIGLPDRLKELLENENVKKAGVAIRDDIKGLQKWSDFTPAGFEELQLIVKDYGIEAAGLKKLCGIILDFRISKAKQLSNWEDEQLSHGQQVYAATDAWTGLLIYKKLLNITIEDE